MSEVPATASPSDQTTPTDKVPAAGRCWLPVRVMAVGVSGCVWAAYLFGALFADRVLLAELVNSFRVVLSIGFGVGLIGLSIGWGAACHQRTTNCLTPCAVAWCRRAAGPWLRLYFALYIATACWCWISVGAAYLPASQPPADGPVLRVMTFNMLGTNESHEAILAEVDRHAPDVLIIWELTYRNAKRFSVIREALPYSLERPHYYETLGFGVYSRYPLTYQTVTWLPDRMLSCPIPELHFELGGRTVRILGIHASNPIHGATWGIRNRQMAALAEIIKSRSLPTIVMGDFNCTPWSPTMKRFLHESGLRDTRQGFGVHPTWPTFGLWLGLPIDHIFVSGDFHVQRRELGNACGSDHVPVICDVSLSQTGAETAERNARTAFRR